MSSTEPSGSVPPAEFRTALGQFASGITIMSTLQDGVAHAMTANAFTSVSLDPPLVLVCVDKGVRMHAAVLDCGYWAASVLSGAQREIAERFARSGRDLYSQFDGIATSAGPKTGCPVVDGSLSWLECRTWATYDGGDHTIVVGEVLSLGTGEPADPSALIYHSSHYRNLPGN
ncbi:flavin reductase family protein [Kribbella sp. NBC_00662]|uniref:flavin reductase family protein n=1 Tax=Kribbella sp. NBC_00662 TaxID=2975969 RepID=UPI003251364A